MTSIAGRPPVEARRGFLKKGLLGGALLVLGGGAGLALFPSAQVASPTAPLLVLTPAVFPVLVAIAKRVVVAPEADHVAIAHRVDESLSRTPVEAQKDVVQLLGLFENALPGLLLDGRLMPFTRLDEAAQDRVLEAWRDSRLALRRGGFQALRKLCLASFYAEEVAWKAIRYEGPPDVGGFFHEDSRDGDGSVEGTMN